MVTKTEFNRLKDDAIKSIEREIVELQSFMEEDKKTGHQRPRVAMAISMRIHDLEQELKETNNRQWIEKR